MPNILKGRIKINTNNSKDYTQTAILHPETNTTQIIDFESGCLKAFNEFIGDSINIKSDNYGNKSVSIPELHVDKLQVDNYVSDRTTPIQSVVTNAINDENNNNIKQTYATKEELKEHDFTVSHITDFVSKVNTLIEQKIDDSGLSKFLPLIGGTINGDLYVNGVLYAPFLQGPTATRNKLGMMKVGSNLDITNGVVNIFPATDIYRGIVKLYQTRGSNDDGAISQKAMDDTLNFFYNDICEALYQKKTDPADKAIHDDKGNIISEYYLSKEYDKVVQETKLKVVANDTISRDFVFNVNNNSYAYPPVEVLRLNDDGDNENVTICEFNNGEESSFIYETHLADDDKFHTISFDGTMFPKTEYNIYMSEPKQLYNGYISVSEIIPLNRFSQRISIIVNTTNNDTNSNEILTSSKYFLSKGILYATTGEIITTEWNTLSDTARENTLKRFINLASTYTNELILDLDEVQVIAYTGDERARFNGTFTGIPNKQLVMAKGLIPTSRFITILNANIIYTQKNHGGVRVAVTNDLEHWYTYRENLQEWKELPAEYDVNIGRYKPKIENMYTNGILASRLGNITDWSLFNENLAFCYLVTKETLADECFVDALSLTVTMRGSWDKYSKAQYSYANRLLVVRVFDSGDYKINYYKYSNS